MSNKNEASTEQPLISKWAIDNLGVGHEWKQKGLDDDGHRENIRVDIEKRLGQTQEIV